MSDEYKQILEDADDLQAEYKKQPCHLERLYGKHSLKYFMLSVHNSVLVDTQKKKC